MPPSDLRTVKECAPQFGKSEAAMRWWLAQPDCPIPTARLGGRVYARQSDIDRVIEEAFEVTT